MSRPPAPPKPAGATTGASPPPASPPPPAAGKIINLRGGNNGAPSRADSSSGLVKAGGRGAGGRVLVRRPSLSPPPDSSGRKPSPSPPRDAATSDPAPAPPRSSFAWRRPNPPATQTAPAAGNPRVLPKRQRPVPGEAVAEAKKQKAEAKIRDGAPSKDSTEAVAAAPPESVAAEEAPVAMESTPGTVAALPHQEAAGSAPDPVGKTSTVDKPEADDSEPAADAEEDDDGMEETAFEKVLKEYTKTIEASSDWMVQAIRSIDEDIKLFTAKAAENPAAKDAMIRLLMSTPEEMAAFAEELAATGEAAEKRAAEEAAAS